MAPSSATSRLMSVSRLRNCSKVSLPSAANSRLVYRGAVQRLVSGSNLASEASERTDHGSVFVAFQDEERGLAGVSVVSADVGEGAGFDLAVDVSVVSGVLLFGDVLPAGRR